MKNNKLFYTVSIINWFIGALCAFNLYDKTKHIAAYIPGVVFTLILTRIISYGILISAIEKKEKKQIKFSIAGIIISLALNVILVYTSFVSGGCNKITILGVCRSAR